MANLGRVMFNIDVKNTDVVIIPEQHLYHKAIVTVPEMVKDNENIIKELQSLLQNLENPTVIFDGDIIHRGISNTEDSYFINDYFRSLQLLTNGKVFSVVGNHELSYRKNNPFWGVSYIASNYILGLVHHTYSVEHPIIGVVDDMLIGDMQYCFGHYGRTYLDSYKLDNNANYLTFITHNSLLTSEISEYMKGKDLDLNEEYISVRDIRDVGNIPLTDKLKYVYVGHMHKARGVFEVEETIADINYNFTIEYLASLGRTNHSEYTDDLERNIPIQSIRDGKFIEETFHKIILPKREESVDERVVLENREAYDRQKQNRELKKITSSSMDLIATVKNHIKDDSVLMDWFNRSSQNEIDPELMGLINKYNY